MGAYTVIPFNQHPKAGTGTHLWLHSDQEGLFNLPQRLCDQLAQGTSFSISDNLSKVPRCQPLGRYLWLFCVSISIENSGCLILNLEFQG